MAGIETRCPHCRAHLSLAAEHAGVRVRCGGCGELFTAPALAAPVPARPVARPVSSARSTGRPPSATHSRHPRADRGRSPGGARVVVALLVLGGVGLAAVVTAVAVGVVWFWGFRQQNVVAEAPAPAPVVAPAAPEAAAPPAVVKPADRPVIVAPAAPPPVAVPDLLPAPADPVPRVKASTVAVRGVLGQGEVATGSGFFVGQPGHVLTNAHVIGRTARNPRPVLRVEVAVTARDGNRRVLPARVVAADPDADLALLRVVGADLPPPLEFGRAADLRETQEVVIYGYPLGDLLGREITVTPTTVTSLRRDRGELAAVQVAGGMHPGNSGGPLADKAGRVVGVCVAVVRGTQIHFAIPAETAQAFLRSGAARPEPGPVAANVPARPPAGPKPGDGPPVERTELKLPAPVAEACAGGGGRYFLLHLPQTRQLAVFDTGQRKVTRFVPLPADDVKFAAGADKLMVVAPAAGTVSRYDLGTFEREVTAPLPFSGTAKQVVMGSASAGPLLVQTVQGPVRFLDPATLKEVEYDRPDVRGKLALAFSDRDAMHFRAAPDGSTFAFWCTSHSQGLQTVVLTGRSARVYAGEMAGIANPTADGVLVCGGGVYTPECKRTAGDDARPRYRLRVPARGGKFYLSCPGGGGAQINTGVLDVGTPTTVYMVGDARPIATLPDVELPAANEAWTGGDFNQDKRVHFVPEARLIAVVPPTNDRIVLYQLDLDAHLEKSGIDYLYVTSRPPATVPGKRFEYQIAVKSKRGGVKFKLDAGPPGMTLSPAGRLAWDVPAGADPAAVIVTVSDARGQEVFHTFRITPTAAGNEAVAAKPPAAKPPAATPPPGKPPELSRPPEPARPAVAAAAGVLRPTTAADGSTVRLPAPADAACVGGGGRFLLFRLPRARQLAVFDVTSGQVVKYLPLAEDGALFAAGTTRLFVLNPTANVIQRWSLATFEKEATVPNPVGGTPSRLLMGHATDGPLYVAGTGVARKHYAFLDPLTFREVEVKVEGGCGGPGVSDRYPPLVRVSADGRVYAWWHVGLSPSGVNSLVLGHGSARAYNEHTSAGALLPGPDGTLFTNNGLYTPELKPLGAKDRGQWGSGASLIPATSGPWYLSVAHGGWPAVGPPGGRERGAARIAVKMVGDDRPLLSLPDLAGLDLPADPFPRVAAGLPLYDRLFLVPEAELLVAVSAGGDVLHLHRFNLKDRLEASGIDYLVVTGRPPAAARGARFSYTPAVLSKKGGVRVKLEAGPEGMAVAGGTVTWDVPAGFAEAEASVILSVTDATGQEVYHTFKLAVRSAQEVKTGGSAPPAAPPGAGAQECDALPFEAAAGPTTAKPCPLTADREERPLPSPAGPATAVGGAGRFLVLHLPKERQLAVFDAAAGKVVKYLPAADDRPLFAAGRSALVVYVPSANALVRYGLPTFEKEVTVACPVEGVQALGMGSAAEGPLFVLTARGVQLLDPKTFRPAAETMASAGSAPSVSGRPPQVHVSEDARLVGGAPGAFALTGGEYRRVKADGYPIPTSDGRAFLTTGQVYTADGRPAGPRVGGHGQMVWYVPAAQGPYYLSLNQTAEAGRSFLELRAHASGETRALFTLPRVDAAQNLIDWHTGSAQPYERHVFLFADVRLLAVLPADRSRLVLYRVDGDDIMAKSGVDYLMVTSRPPSAVAPGETLRYAPTVRSRKGKARLRLESGPAGMKLAGGRLTWAAPADFSAPVTVVLAVSDASGQEFFHTFTVSPETVKTKSEAGARR